MSALQPSNDEILTRFALAFRQDSGALGLYCRDHPELAKKLIDLAHELAMQQSLAGDAPLDAATVRWIEAACAEGARQGTDPFAGLGSQGYQALRESLDVPSVVLNAFRDRMVSGGTVPLSFLERLAGALQTGMVELATYLAGPPKLAQSASHRAARAPRAGADKISFSDLLTQAGVPSERQADLLAEDD